MFAVVFVIMFLYYLTQSKVSIWADLRQQSFFVTYWDKMYFLKTIIIEARISRFDWRMQAGMDKTSQGRSLPARTSSSKQIWISFELAGGTTDVCNHHYSDNIMGAVASQITSLTIVYSGIDQIKCQSSASLAFVRGIHRWPVNSPHKWSVTRKMSPFDDIIKQFFLTWHLSSRQFCCYPIGSLFRKWWFAMSTLTIHCFNNANPSDPMKHKIWLTLQTTHCIRL